VLLGRRWDRNHQGLSLPMKGRSYRRSVCRVSTEIHTEVTREGPYRRRKQKAPDGGAVSGAFLPHPCRCAPSPARQYVPDRHPNHTNHLSDKPNLFSALFYTKPLYGPPYRTSIWTCVDLPYGPPYGPLYDLHTDIIDLLHGRPFGGKMLP